jgi:hypothetical protein
MLFALLGLGFQAHGEVITLPEDTVVYGHPDSDARVTFRLAAGSRVAAAKPARGFRFIKFKRRGKIHSGYIQALTKARSNENQPRFAFGVGILNSNLSQNGKSFATADQVNYTTSKYSSSNTYPELIAQYGLPTSYWRLKLAQRISNFKSSATKDLMGSGPQPLYVDYTFLSGVLQKTWPLLTNRFFYWGLGAEVAQGSSVKVTLGGVNLQTSTTDKPTFLGVEGLAGGTVSIWNGFSGFVEAEYIVIANQSPLIMGLQINLGITY